MVTQQTAPPLIWLGTTSALLCPCEAWLCVGLKEIEILFSGFLWSHLQRALLLWCLLKHCSPCTACWRNHCSPIKADYISAASNAIKRHLVLRKDKLTFYLTSLMLVISVSRNIDSLGCAVKDKNGQQLVGGISYPCPFGFPEDAK